MLPWTAHSFLKGLTIVCRSRDGNPELMAYQSNTQFGGGPLPQKLFWYDIILPIHNIATTYAHFICSPNMASVCTCKKISAGHTHPLKGRASHEA